MKPLSTNPFMVFDASSDAIRPANRVGLSLAATDGHRVSSYVELLEKVAALCYSNSRFQLVYRGQRRDYQLNIDGNAGDRGILYPSILRPIAGQSREQVLDERFDRLRSAESQLVKALPVADLINLRVVRWAILQHYEICDTPLLDVTRSLQCALSFAYADGSRDEGFLFVMAVPHLTGPVSISTESMTQAIDLSQVCPPAALRPHFQSGILLGDYPEYTDRQQTHNRIGFVDNDFSCRLITKFHLNHLRTWDAGGFHPIDREIMFPDKRDAWYPILQAIKRNLTS